MKNTKITGMDLALHQMEQRGWVCFNIISQQGELVASQPDHNKDLTTAQTELQEICDMLPFGRYKLILTKEGSEETGKAVKGKGGTNTHTIPIYINQTGGHMDINSHNATGSQGISMKDYMAALNQINELKSELSILKIKLENEEINGGSKGIAEQVLGFVEHPAVGKLVEGITAGKALIDAEKEKTKQAAYEAQRAKYQYQTELLKQKNG
jgi:hypothetical protein